MKKVLATVLACVLSLSLAACAKSNTEGTNANKSDEPNQETLEFRVGLEANYAPFNWTQSKETETSVSLASGGYADGYDVQIAKIIAEKLGRKLVLVKTEWDGLTLSLTSGKIDAIIAGMSPTAERALTIDFTEPYYESDLVVVVNKDSQYANATSLDDLAGAKITGQLNTFHYSVIDQIPNVEKITAMSDFPAMVVALTSGKIDGYVSERPGAISAIASNPNLTYISFEEGKGFEASPEDVAVAVGLKQEDDELREQINAILAEISKEQRQQLMDQAIENQPAN